ncbi:MAG: cytochrome c oxidase accessory protein CcoG [Zetaproteobacteria bacterium CG12_big_fil_rev_8_21_14_0_65_55_1124]|nr:MAG: cytochrome c oxidase accessory protein CcoG [Zetaproteobacteria bacterium CG1_02_55_237]PIS19090.1 MAG: cytochrome c oxidase accessory protein CcoG [Zetaproteobacteria bacterium CG08_land_8_20_14_0_20_55_17]PIW42121.1 MAG: cytochrome c oxidase accessory protein CcoG [Zetaproteobacteria bacterium CG12_big_fil_rev_8_21_14_0_65_55_1124]PIY52406.1 MAG: cytochrome c oxidase accessory protein CcoG [Zetaproteobacteria bacterium CG_4_10_14_0_8_um_filter_55_43]PIZ37334.1 MAG: cytochrome c oxidas
MSEENKQGSIEDIYADAAHWHVNTGGETIHAKRMPGRFRNYKWYASILWLLYFIGPYFRWDGQQAIFFDIPHRQFHMFSLTVWPQDIWVLSLVLILLAMTLFGVTAVAGRVWCGYFCFQTVWTDWFTWLEDKIEGNPIQRRKLDAAPWDARKIRLKLFKHTLWMLIAIVTGITFAAYFTDAFDLWHRYLTLDAPLVAWVVLAAFIFGTYVFAGFMREQVCFWLCPYARIQSVMLDKDTELPTYDTKRGEPRGKVRGKESEKRGDCIDCHLCVGVCPTGVDIREGMQEGCISCGMCIDACDSIMDKVNRPRGLIRYASEKEMMGISLPPLFKRPRVIAYSTIFLLAVTGIIYGLSHIPPVELSVVHERQPLFIQMSNGDIHNKYTIKAVNKTLTDMHVKLSISDADGVEIVGGSQEVVLQAGRLLPFSVFLSAKPAALKEKKTKIRFILENIGTPAVKIEYKSVFMSPSGS